MKKCNECNVEMTEGLGIRADEGVSVDNKFKLYIVKNEESYYGRRLSDNEVKCRICPNCGKVELYINPDDLKNRKEGFKLF